MWRLFCHCQVSPFGASAVLPDSDHFRGLIFSVDADAPKVFYS